MATDNPPGLDYRQLGLICGIEIHQQLDTACKLFCGCPTVHQEVEDSNFEFFRYLRPSRGELGQIDRAALPSGAEMVMDQLQLGKPKVTNEAIIESYKTQL